MGGGGPSAPIEIEFSRNMSSSDSFPKPPAVESGIFANSQTASGPFTTLSPAPGRLSPEDERKEKVDLLNKLQRMEQKGLTPSRRFTMDNTLEEIKTEYARLVDSKNLEASIRFQRQALMSVVTGMEWMNGKFDPFDIKLDGWSESVHENVEDFDEIFEELYDKYKERGKMPPEAPPGEHGTMGSVAALPQMVPRPSRLVSPCPPATPNQLKPSCAISARAALWMRRSRSWWPIPMMRPLASGRS